MRQIFFQIPHFYPLPSGEGRLGHGDSAIHGSISIHSPRVRGDRAVEMPLALAVNFYPLPSGEGRL